MQHLSLAIQKKNLKVKKEGKNFADEVFNLLLFFLIFVVLIFEIFAPYLVYLIAPGFYIDPNKFSIATEFTRITFPFLLFVSLSSLLSGVLNSNNKFAAAAAAPIVLNIILILSMILSFLLNLNFARNLSIGVTLSGLIQLIILIIFTKKYYFPSLSFNFKIKKRIKIFFEKLLPSIFSSGITQINILIGTIIASFQSGAVSYLYYADRVYQINLAIAGIAVGTVALPALSRSIKLKNQNSIDLIQNKSLELCLLLSIPACFGLLIASEEIVSSLFGYKSFRKEDVIFTSLALKFFCIWSTSICFSKSFIKFLFCKRQYKNSILYFFNKHDN